MTIMKNHRSFPALPLEEWEETKETLHRFVQIVGKIRMQLMPFQNHWWHVPLYITTRGLGTGPIPYKDQRFEIDFDFVDHRLIVSNNKGQTKSFDLQDGISVAEFYDELFSILDEIDVHVKILAKPYDLSPDTPFADDSEHHHYDYEYVERFWSILQQIDRIFRTFNSDFCGKVCPVQLYWHSFDLAVTRFSGKEAPPMPNAGKVDREAYSHEVISFGFWPGDPNTPQPAFYSYTFPAPEGLDTTPLQPSGAHWVEQNGSPLALLFYEDVRQSTNPEKAILDFLESTYQAGTQKAEWDVARLNRKTITKA